MAELGYGDRVMAGEDSEEEDDDDAVGFQFGGFMAKTKSPLHPAPRRSTPPKFHAPTPVPTPPSLSAEGSEVGDEDEESEEGEAESQVNAILKTMQEPPQPDALARDGGSEDARVAPAEKQELWVVDGKMDGVATMGSAVAQRLHPSLAATIHRIAELTENQQRLLDVLAKQNATVNADPKLERIVQVMSQLPTYIKKVQDIKASMTDVSTSVDRMKKRAENLRIDAQSYAIQKENKRESQSQWNKLFAAKNTDATAMPARSFQVASDAAPSDAQS